jgi:MoxR-like ATPase
MSDFQPVYFDPGGNGARAGYVFSDDIVLAVNAALATERVLLVEGPPGSGKSTLAAAAAKVLEWRYYERVITSRTSAQDLLWRFDALKRLADAQTQSVQPPEAYVEPEILWWALAPNRAARRGSAVASDKWSVARDPATTAKKPDAVVLLDEIDKADPDMPNDLLSPLGVGAFEVRDTGAWITREAGHRTLVIVTSNGERTLAPAFVRRCVRLELAAHDEESLMRIGEMHLPYGKKKVHRAIAKWCIDETPRAKLANRRAPSTAEFLDIARACGELGIDTSGDAWNRLTRFLGQKPEPTTT